MDNNPEPDQPRPGGLLRFWRELRRRKVVRVAMTYVVTGWIIIQVASATFADFGIPAWAFRFVVLMVCLGFPLAVILAWAFELTPDGIRTTRATAEEPETPEHPDHHRKRNWMAYGLGALLPTLIFGSLALYFYIQAPAPEVAVETAPLEVLEAEAEEPEKSIAVLPLENLSPDPDNAFFAAGVHEDILTNLSRIQALRVISRSSTLRYSNPERDMGKIGSELGVRYLVEGSVRRVGDRVRVTVQLIDARTDDHLWAENYDRTLEDIFAIQSAVAKEIAGQLQAMISPEEEAEIDELPTTNMEAYDLFLRTRNRAPLAEDADLLEKAVDLDPEFLDAWVQLTYNRLFRWRITGRLNDDLLSDAMTAYDQVSRLAKDSNEVSWLEESIAFNMDDDLEGALLMALKNYKEKAIGLRSIQLGRLEEADHYLEEGLKGSPFDLITLHRAYTTKIYLGKFDEAYKKLKVALDFMDPLEGPSFLLYFEAQHDYLEKGDRREFVNALEALGYNEDLRFMLMKASVTHDFTAVLEALENNSIRLGVRDRALWSTLGFKLLNYSVGTDVGYTLKPDHLLSALIRFEMGGGKHLAGSVEKARQYWESINNGYPRKDPTNLASLALCYALEGDRERMEALLPEIRELTGNVNWQFRRQVPCELLIAMAYVVLGDHDKAIETLEAASTMNGCLLLNRELNVWFIFDRLRGDPRFEALLQ